MNTAKDYPITTPYGLVAGYPLNNGFHKGIDYGCPTDTPIVVNGVTIGLSGSTGYASGPHLHVGRWVNGQVTDPGVGKGFTFDSAVVTEINEDDTNGKYVRVEGDGASWVYLHMSNNHFTHVGQTLKGAAMSYIEPATIRSLSRDFNVPLTDDQVQYYSNHPGGYTELYTDFLKYNYAIRKQLESGSGYELVTDKLFRKKG